jgi:SRSO17 transposase
VLDRHAWSLLRRLTGWLDQFKDCFGHRAQHVSLRQYVDGLLGDSARKSMSAMLARVSEPTSYQAFQHFITHAPWEATVLWRRLRAVTPERTGILILDETSFPKSGPHSVGVARQYCGQLGKQDNCQIAVSLSVANDHASLPVAWRLYLPEGWANDPDRRTKAGVPEDITFRTKPEIALDEIQAALSVGVPRGVVLADAGYGIDTAFRSGLTAMGLTYIVGIQSSTCLWPPGMGPLPPKAWSGRGRPPSLVRRNPEHKPLSAKELAQALPGSAWRTVTWRQGTNAPLSSRFAAMRVRPSHRDYWRSAPRPEEWFLAEWPQGENEPTKYWLSTLPEDTTLAGLVDQAKLRWRIERDYQELKQEIGLGHYEGRGWRGFHHHATLSIAAYGFLVSERSLIPPSGRRRKLLLKAPRLPTGYRPRGTPAPTRTPRRQLHRHSPN